MSNAAPYPGKTGRLLAMLAAGPCTLADLKAVTKAPTSLISDARQCGAVIECNRRARPPVYRLVQMPPPQPAPPQLNPKYQRDCWSKADFTRLTGLPTDVLPLRWTAGSFPAAVIFDRLADAAKQDPAYQPALAALAAGASNHG